MNLFELTRALVDIESITDNEERVGEFLFDYLQALAVATRRLASKRCPWPSGGSTSSPTGASRLVTLSTHIDTVPPFFASREDDEYIWGRGACDTKGIIASMIKAVEALLASGERNLGLLFVVGEERNSAGAYTAAKTPRGSRFLINGEPTENKLALGSKGALRYEIVATGRMAHSAYPELGESAIEKLLDALADICGRSSCRTDPILGPSTLNIGTHHRRPRAERHPGRSEGRDHDPAGGRRPRNAAGRASKAVGRLAEAARGARIPAVRLGSSTDSRPRSSRTPPISRRSAAHGASRFCSGPAPFTSRTRSEERVPKRQLIEAVEMYQRIARDLLGV